MDRPFYIEVIGLIAAALTTTAFLPQVYKTWKTKDVSALSLPMLLLFFIGIVLWLVYGIYMESLAMIVANSVTIVSSLLLLYFKIAYSKSITSS
ncbi:MAG: SemiSWEET transporter [Flavobacteriaceae bacterium]|nr:SemiSWEET transporter [Flavobacteriaceae bacterium]